MNYKQTFNRAEMILNDRQNKYGSARPLHENIATRWSLVLGVEVNPVQVARCMAELKSARMDAGDADDDSLLDLINYIAIAAALRDEDSWDCAPVKGGNYAAN